MSRLYNSVKAFHFPGKLRDIAEGRITAPIHVRLKPTNRCNHGCDYCCYRNQALAVSERVDLADEIPRNKMREIVRDLGEMGVRAVTLSGGGEPLCYPHILETMQAIRAGGMKLAMLTNGALLEGEAAQLLAREATWVRISIDAADGETYAQIRGCPLKEFDRVCENLREFSRTKSAGCELGINFIVTRENSRDVLKFLRLAKTLGVNHVKVSNAIVSTDAEENSRYMAPFYQEVKRQVAEGAAELQTATFSVIDKVHLPDAAAEGFGRSYARCPFIQFLTVIAADQNVYVCHDKAYTTGGLLGSIREQSFRELWTGEAAHEKLLAVNPSEDCRHHCVHNSVNLALLDYFAADEEHLDFV